jgi:hypothetical protein
MDLDQPLTYEATNPREDSRELSLVFGDFPRVIDNVIRSTFISCEKKFEYSFLSNLSPLERSIHLHAGGAFAAGMEATRRSFYVNGRPADESIAEGAIAIIREWKDFDSGDQAKSLSRMCGALEYYFDVWKLGEDYLVPWTTPDGEKGIEFSFAIPLPIAHPQTGDPVLYAGRFDMLAIDRYKVIWVEDEKTASRLGASWNKNWTLDSQLTGYVWAARMYNIPVYGAAIRGISILKTMYGHAEQMVARHQYLVDRWYGQLLRDVERMIEIWKGHNQEYAASSRYALDKGICNSYGGCSYEILCNSQNPEQWVPVNFTHRDWDPMTRDTPGAGLGTQR